MLKIVYKKPWPTIFPSICQVSIVDYLYLGQDVALLLTDIHHIIFDDSSQPTFSLQLIQNSTVNCYFEKTKIVRETC